MDLKDSVCRWRERLNLRTNRDVVESVVAENPVEIYLPPGCTFDGELQAEGSIRIEGRVRGKVRAPVVIIGEGSHVTAEVEAHCFYVAGLFRGIAHVAFFYLTADGEAEADISTESCFLDAGGNYSGRLRMKKGTNGYVCETGQDSTGEAE